jgi:hypothetical protein
MAWKRSGFEFAELHCERGIRLRSPIATGYVRAIGRRPEHAEEVRDSEMVRKFAHSVTPAQARTFETPL